MPGGAFPVNGPPRTLARASSVRGTAQTDLFRSQCPQPIETQNHTPAGAVRRHCGHAEKNPIPARRRSCPQRCDRAPRCDTASQSRWTEDVKCMSARFRPLPAHQQNTSLRSPLIWAPGQCAPVSIEIGSRLNSDCCGSTMGLMRRSSARHSRLLPLAGTATVAPNWPKLDRGSAMYIRCGVSKIHRTVLPGEPRAPKHPASSPVGRSVP